jgi:hypothetical protein
MTKLDWALKHAFRGWAVFPLIPNAKLPATKGWQDLATTDAHQIRSWWNENPDYNIGIACGAKSELLVLDIDDRQVFVSNGQQAWYNETIQKLYTVGTPSGGLHYYFLGTGYKNRVKQIPGADIRCEGGYVVAAGSNIEDNEYVETAGFIESLPYWLATTLTQPRVGASIDAEAFPEGSRNNSLTAAGGVLRRRGLLTLNTLLALNDDKCVPPLEANEVELIYSSLMSYGVTAPIDAPQDDALPYVKLSDLKQQMADALTDKDRLQGTPTNIPTLDKLLGGGLRQGEFLALVAAGKTGKSSLLHQIIYNLVKNNIPIGYASREMRPHDEVAPNLVSIAFNENAWKAEQTPERQERYNTALDTWPLYFTSGYGTYLLESFGPWVRALHAKGVNHFFVDHLHYCLVDPEDYKEAVKLAQAFKKLANELDIHIFSIIQPTKIYEGQSLGLQSLRGGAGLGQAIDALLTLERFVDNNGERSDDISVLRVSDIRNKLGRTGRMFLQYDATSTKIREVDVVTPKVNIEVKDEAPLVDEEMVQTSMAKAVS